jgi:hypothetical protein
MQFHAHPVHADAHTEVYPVHVRAFLAINHHTHHFIADAHAGANLGSIQDAHHTHAEVRAIDYTKPTKVPSTTPSPIDFHRRPLSLFWREDARSQNSPHTTGLGCALGSEIRTRGLGAQRLESVYTIHPLLITSTYSRLIPHTDAHADVEYPTRSTQTAGLRTMEYPTRSTQTGSFYANERFTSPVHPTPQNTPPGPPKREVLCQRTFILDTHPRPQAGLRTVGKGAPGRVFVYPKLPLHTISTNSTCPLPCGKHRLP